MLKVRYKKLYNKLKEKAFSKVFFTKEFLFIKKEDFEPYRKFFKEPQYKNRFNSGLNLRTKELFFHIHLVEYKDFVQLHIDIWNLDRYYFLWFLHFFCDVIPYYLLWGLKKNVLKNEVEKFLTPWEKY